MAKVLICYNCGEPNHISLFCPLPQRYTRCSCDVVNLGKANIHKPTCDTQNFRSRKNKLESDSFVEMNKMMDVEFRSVDDVVLVGKCGVHKKMTTPVLVNSSLQIAPLEKGFSVFGNNKATIIIVDESNMRRIKLDVSNNLVINGYYSLLPSGKVTYDRRSDPNAIGPFDVCVKVTTNDPLFDVRVKWNGHVYYLQVYPDGVLLKDPVENFLKRRLNGII